MKRSLIFLFLILIAFDAYGQQANGKISIDESAKETYVISDNNITLGQGGKSLCLMLEGMENSTVLEDISRILLKIEEEIPVIVIEAEDVITIKQAQEGLTEISLIPPINLDDNKSVVYLTEHYVPDKGINDVSRVTGLRKVAAISKGTAIVSVKSISGNLRKLTLNIREFLDSGEDYGKNAEFDFLKKDIVTEMFFFENSLIIRSYNFVIDPLFDRGFTSKKVLKEPQYADFGKIEDQYPERCNKLAVIFNETDYNLSEAHNLTEGQGIVFLESDDTEKIKEFTDESKSAGVDIGIIINTTHLTPGNISDLFVNYTANIYINVLKGSRLSDEEMDSYANYTVTLKSMVPHLEIISGYLDDDELFHLSGNKDFLDSLSYFQCMNCTAEELINIENSTGKKYPFMHIDQQNEILSADAEETEKKLSSVMDDESIGIYALGSGIFDEDKKEMKGYLSSFCSVP